MPEKTDSYRLSHCAILFFVKLWQLIFVQLTVRFPVVGNGRHVISPDFVVFVREQAVLLWSLSDDGYLLDCLSLIS